MLFKTISFLLLASGILGASSEFEAAQKILKAMDEALMNRNYEEFLGMHDDKFQFKFCEETGGKKELEEYLKNDLQLAQVWKSKHSIQPNEFFHRRGRFYFGYEQNLLLNSYLLYKTTGRIIFELDESKDPKILSANEECSVLVF